MVGIAAIAHRPTGRLLQVASTSKIALVTPIRCYAAPTNNKNETQKSRQGFRGATKGQGGTSISARREKRLGAFRSLSANQLTHPLFGIREELRLPPFPESLTTQPVGSAMQFHVSERNAIRIYGVPKNLLVEFRVLSTPCSVVRDTTLTVVEKLDVASEQSSSNSRFVLTGSPGCGKSFLLLQAVEYCVAKDWIVLYIPRAINLVNSTTAYSYDPHTQTYLQPIFSYQILQRFLTVNSNSIEQLVTQGEISLDRRPPVPAGTPLSTLISMGLKDQSIAPAVLSALLDQLGLQKEFPVLLAVDDFQALYCKSLYRDPHFSAIKSYHLSVPRLLLEYASGKRTFARGAVLGAISSHHVDFLLPLELREALSVPHDRPAGPYVKRSTELMEYSQGLQALPVPDKLSIDEAASLFEVWMKDKGLHSTPNDELFLTKYTEASGNARDFVWKGLLSTLDS